MTGIIRGPLLRSVSHPPRYAPIKPASKYIILSPPPKTSIPLAHYSTENPQEPPKKESSTSTDNSTSISIISAVVGVILGGVTYYALDWRSDPSRGFSLAHEVGQFKDENESLATKTLFKSLKFFRAIQEVLSPQIHSLEGVDKTGNPPKEPSFHSVYKLCKEGKWDSLREYEPIDLTELRDEQGKSLLITAVEEGDETIIKKLFELRVYPSRFYGYNLIQIAALNGHAHLIPILYYYCSLNNFTPDGQTALSLAIRRGNAAVVTALLREKLDLNLLAQVGREKLSPSALAVYYGKSNCLRALQQGSSKEAIEEALAAPLSMGNTIHLAVYANQLEMVSYLFSCYPSLKRLVNDRDIHGRTPVHIAALKGLPHMMNLLVQNGAELDAVDSQGYSCAHLAALARQPQVLQYLNRKGFTVKETQTSPLDLLKDDRSLAAQRCRELLQQHSLNITTFIGGLAALSGGTSSLFGASGGGLSSIGGLVTAAVLAQRHSPSSKVLLDFYPETLLFQEEDVTNSEVLNSLTIMQKNGHLANLSQVGGHSTGALLATLLSVGYSPREIQELLKTERFLSPLALENGERSHPTAKNSSQAFSVDTLRAWIDHKIFKKTGIVNCTFGELHRLVQQDTNTTKDLLFLIRDTEQKKNFPVVNLAKLDSQSPTHQDLVIADSLLYTLAAAGMISFPTLRCKDTKGVLYTRSDWERLLEPPSSGKDLFPSNPNLKLWEEALNERLGLFCPSHPPPLRGSFLEDILLRLGHTQSAFLQSALKATHPVCIPVPTNSQPPPPQILQPAFTQKF